MRWHTRFLVREMFPVRFHKKSHTCYLFCSYWQWLFPLASAVLQAPVSFVILPKTSFLCLFKGNRNIWVWFLEIVWWLLGNNNAKLFTKIKWEIDNLWHTVSSQLNKIPSVVETKILLEQMVWALSGDCIWLVAMKMIRAVSKTAMITVLERFLKEIKSLSF